MINQSYLLAVTGSKQSYLAAQLAFALSSKTHSQIIAQHVVDTDSACEFLACEGPGLLPESRYEKIYNDLSKELYKMGQDITDAYAVEASRHNIVAETAIDEGCPAQKIAERADRHDMVIIGHQPKEIVLQDVLNTSNFLKLSTAEILAHICPRPLLVVQDECDLWSVMTILLSLDHINELYINGCLDLAEKLGLSPTIIGLKTGLHEQDDDSFIHSLRAANRRLKNVPIAVLSADEIPATGKIANWHSKNIPADFDQWAGTLIVIPTREINQRRITVFDSSPSSFVRNLTLPSILLYPEESAGVRDQEAKRKENIFSTSIWD